MIDFAELHAEIEEEENDVSGRFLTFLLGGQRFAIRITDISQIMGMPQITPIPEAPAYILGLMDLRGEVLPVLDGRRRILKLETPCAGRPGVIVVRNGESSLGLVVDKVEDILSIPEEEISKAPVLDREDPAAPYLAGYYRSGNQLLTLLDPDTFIVQNAHFAQERA